MSETANNPATSGQGDPGQIGLFAGNSDLNTMRAVFFQLLARCRTAGLVQVQSCTVAGAAGPVGFVDVVPVIGLVNGLFQVSPHGLVRQLCYSRLQAGGNAVIMDPQEGDVGVAVFCDRDISSAKNLSPSQLAALDPSSSPVPPGSGRRFDMADGVYVFSCLGGNPTQYIQFLSTGINLLDVSGNTIQTGSAGIKINNVLFDRNQNVTNINEATSQSGVKLTQHVHPGVTVGGGNTGLPTG